MTDQVPFASFQLSAQHRLLAESQVKVGEHWQAEWLGFTFNLDTIIATLVASAIVLGLAFYLRAKVTSGVPGGVQLFWEAITVQLRGQIESSIGLKVAPFVLPLAITLFVFILVSNWLSVVPLQIGDEELIKPPASDINFTLALALFVFILYHVAGIRRRRGLFRYLKKIYVGHVGSLPKPIVMVFSLINFIEELAKPISLSLRLFGNMFAGGIMVALIALFPWYVQWAPNALWKLFDLFVGLVQAFIFALLTILYFGQSMELDDEHH